MAPGRVEESGEVVIQGLELGDLSDEEDHR